MSDPLKIVFLNENGTVQTEILGHDILAGQKPQVICPGGIWKAYDLMEGEFTLVGEALAPGFDYQDLRMPTFEELQVRCPIQALELKKYIASHLSPTT